MDSLERHRRMVEQHPGNELARFSLGRALFDRGEFAEARVQFLEALQRRPDWMAVQILIGRCALELGDRGAAVAALEQARELAIAQHHEGPLAEVEGLLADLQG